MKDEKKWAHGPAERALSRSAITVLRSPPATKGVREIFNVATIERVAERLFATDGSRPLVGRLKYLRGMGFPSPVAKGRGTRAVLGLDEMVQTLFALQLIHAGVAPTRAIRTLRTDWATVKSAIGYGWSRANGIGNPERPYRSLVIAPLVLTELGGDERADEPLNEVLGIRSFDELTEMQSRGEAPVQMLIIDTQAFAIGLAGIEESILGVSAEKFAEEMRMFCGEAFGSDKPTKWDVPQLAGTVLREKP